MKTISIPCELYFYSIPEFIKDKRNEYAENCIKNLKSKKECITSYKGFNGKKLNTRKFYPGEELEAKYAYLMKDNIKFKDTYNYFLKRNI